MSSGIPRSKSMPIATVVAAVLLAIAGLLAGCQRFGGAAEQAPAPTKSATGQGASSASTPQQAAQAQKLVVKFSHVVAEDTPKHKAALKFKEVAEKLSNGAI